MIQTERICALNHHGPVNGAYVLYWMQSSQRAGCNHALEYALAFANEHRLPVVVLFCLMDRYPDSNLRHYSFMLAGLQATFDALRERGITAVMLRGEPESVVPEAARRARLVVTDRGYTRHQRRWRPGVARRIECPLIQVETDVIVPVETASPKEEYAAATFRPKIGRVLLRYMVPLSEQEAQVTGFRPDMDAIEPVDGLKTLTPVLDRSVPPVDGTPGGHVAAEHRLKEFLDSRLDTYGSLRSDPAATAYSGLSPYLHFGQISPLEVALAASDHGGPGAESFLEELIVRRELAVNFTYYNQSYDSFACLPDWAQSTLKAHETDTRPYHYSREELETAATHDEYWNAAQREMRLTGSMHNYMRMYWGKKILEWCPGPSEAFDTALYLNNKWQLDGRDPNSYAGVAWCFGKHDRPWGERSIFGKVRYMSAGGLERKFDIKSYVSRFT